MSDNNSLSDKIIEILTPIVGKMMSHSIIKVQCEKLGKTPETLTPADLPLLAERFETHLRIFIGTEKSSEIARHITSIRS